MYYISELDFMEDDIQPHNFIMVNGAYLADHYKTEFADRRDLTAQFKWIDVTIFSNENEVTRIATDNFFDSEVFRERNMIEAGSVIVINTSTAKFKIELMANSWVYIFLQ